MSGGGGGRRERSGERGHAGLAGGRVAVGLLDAVDGVDDGRRQRRAERRELGERPAAAGQAVADGRDDRPAGADIAAVRGGHEELPGLAARLGRRPVPAGSARGTGGGRAAGGRRDDHRGDRRPDERRTVLTGSRVDLPEEFADALVADPGAHQSLTRRNRGRRGRGRRDRGIRRRGRRQVGRTGTGLSLDGPGHGERGQRERPDENPGTHERCSLPTPNTQVQGG